MDHSALRPYLQADISGRSASAHAQSVNFSPFHTPLPPFNFYIKKKMLRKRKARREQLFLLLHKIYTNTVNSVKELYRISVHNTQCEIPLGSFSCTSSPKSYSSSATGSWWSVQRCLHIIHCYLHTLISLRFKYRKCYQILVNKCLLKKKILKVPNIGV